MARHSLFPNSTTINYTSNAHSHKMVIPTGAVTGLPGAASVPTRDGGTVLWETAVTELVTLLQPLFDEDSAFESAELFTYEATDSPAEFIALFPIGLPGTSLNPAVPFSQVVFPFKALGGTSLRFTLIESTTVPDIRNSFGAETDAVFCELMEYILGDDDWLITRGGTFPLASLGYTSKTNDKLRKRYFLG